MSPKRVLILTATDEELQNIKEIILVISPLILSYTLDIRGTFRADFKTGGDVEIWSIQSWKDTLTCGKMFDEIIYFCKPPLFIRQALAPCNAKLINGESGEKS
jgi:hypothetical protein